MLRSVRDLLGALGNIGEALHRIAAAQAEDTTDGLRERIDELERSRAIWEAEIEGLLMKAKSKHNEARSAEERTRHLAKKNSKDLNNESFGGSPFDFAEAGDGFPHVEARPGAGMPPVPTVLEDGNANREQGEKEQVRNRKWGR